MLGRGRVLFVGDAAGATDPLTGEGIGQALLTGVLAADAIAGAGASRPEVAQRPLRSTAVRAELVADHRMSTFLGKVLVHRRGALRGDRASPTSNDWTRRNFARWLFEDEPRAAALTPRRWHRRFLRRPGAFT